jgi:hypothetical protein
VFEDCIFDIFREYADGSTCWIASVRELPDAEAHMNMMAWQRPGKYFVWHDGGRVADVDTSLCAQKVRIN